MIFKESYNPIALTLLQISEQIALTLLQIMILFVLTLLH